MNKSRRPRDRYRAVTNPKNQAMEVTAPRFTQERKTIVRPLNISKLGGKLDHNAIVQRDGSQGTNRALTNAINLKEFLR